jgi:hypothetical protein
VDRIIIIMVALATSLSFLSLEEVLPKKMYGISLILMTVIMLALTYTRPTRAHVNRAILPLASSALIVSLSSSLSYSFLPIYPKSGDWVYYYMGSVLFSHGDMTPSIYESSVQHALGWHLLVHIISTILNIPISTVYHAMMTITSYLLLLTFFSLIKRIHVAWHSAVLAILLTLFSVPIVFDTTHPIPRSLAVVLTIAMVYVQLLLGARVLALILATASTSVHNGVGFIYTAMLVVTLLIYGIYDTVRHQRWEYYKVLLSSSALLISSSIVLYIGAFDKMLRYASGYRWDFVAHIKDILRTAAVSDIDASLDPVSRPFEETFLRTFYALNFGTYLALPFVSLLLHLKRGRRSPISFPYLLFNYLSLFVGIVNYAVAGFLSSIRAISVASPIVLISAVHMAESLRLLKNINQRALWAIITTLALLNTLGGALTLGQSGYQALYLINDRVTYHHLGYPRYLSNDQQESISRFTLALDESNTRICSDSFQVFLIRENNISNIKLISSNFGFIWFEAQRGGLEGCQVIIVIQDLVPIRGFFNVMFRMRSVNPMETYTQVLGYLSATNKGIIYTGTTQITVYMMGLP